MIIEIRLFCRYVANFRSINFPLAFIYLCHMLKLMWFYSFCFVYLFFIFFFIFVSFQTFRYCRSGDHTIEREIEGGFIDSASYICRHIATNWERFTSHERNYRWFTSECESIEWRYAKMQFLYKQFIYHFFCVSWSLNNSIWFTFRKIDIQQILFHCLDFCQIRSKQLNYFYIKKFMR